MKVGILEMAQDDVSVSFVPTVTNITIVLEEAVVLKDVPDLPTAVAILFGLLFTLNMEYPKEVKYTFEVIEKIFFELNTQCSSRVQSIQTMLFL